MNEERGRYPHLNLSRFQNPTFQKPTSVTSCTRDDDQQMEEERRRVKAQEEEGEKYERGDGREERDRGQPAEALEIGFLKKKRA